MAKVVVYSTRFCPYCVAAKRLLTAKNVEFSEIAVDVDVDARMEMQRLSGRTSVPQIFVDDQHVGGFSELSSLDRAGELDRLLGRV